MTINLGISVKPQATPPLPFSRTQVTSMDWRTGDATCAVTYAAVSGMVPRTVRVALADFQAVFPDVERCLRVAQVLTNGFSNRGEMMVAYVGRWTSEVFTDSPGKFIYRGLIGLSEWASECKFSYEMRWRVDETGDYQHKPCCCVTWKDGSKRLEDIDILEANFPGFTELCHVLCIEQRVDSNEAFKILAALVSSLPFKTLQANTGYFKAQLVLCDAVGMPPTAIASHLLAGLNTATPAGLVLPDLLVDPA